MRKITWIMLAAAAIVLAGCKNTKKSGNEEVPTPVGDAVENVADAAKDAADKVGDAVREGLGELGDVARAEADKLSETGAEALKKAGIDAVPFAVVEVKPTFNGGDAEEFPKWVAKNVNYPQEAKDEGIEGKTFVQFNVAKTGGIDNVVVLKTSGNETLDECAVEAVKKSSKLWEPGSQNGNAVNVSYILPVVFKVQ